MAPNYKNGKIYKLVSDHVDKVYIGSTQLKYLCLRLGTHKQHYKNWVLKKRNYITSFDILKYDDVKIILLESFPCNTKDELCARERYYIETLDCVNKRIPGRTMKEYVAQPHMREIARKKSKIYYNNNKQKVLDREKSRRIHKIKCNCGSSVIKAHYEKHKLSGLHKKKLAKTIKIHANWCKSIDEIESWFEDSLTNEFNEICAKIDAVIFKN